MNLRVDELYSYMREREAIRLRRATGVPPPWTDDPILATWKFTTVHREHDRTSRFLIDRFYQPALVHKVSRAEVLFNAAVFRYFGTSEFAAAVGWNPPSVAALDAIEHIAHDRMAAGKRVYTGAYMLKAGSNKGEPKQQTICRIYLTDLLHKLRYITANDKESWEVATRRLCEVEGFGEFMAKEVILDARYAGYWTEDPIDWNTWTPIGPGALKGAAIISDNYRINDEGEIKSTINRKIALDICRELYSVRKDHWPKEYGDLALTDIHWSCCEILKYLKVKMDLGRPRSRFVASTDGGG